MTTNAAFRITCFTARAIADLRRSWRIVLPNLEQCGLLTVTYADLERRAVDAAWNSFPLIGDLKLEGRKEFIGTILDFFCLEYAIHSENYLTQSKIKEYEKHFREILQTHAGPERGAS